MRDTKHTGRQTDFAYDTYGRGPPVDDGSVGAALALAVAVPALLWAVSYPLLAASLVAGLALALGLLRAGLAALARRMHGHIRRLDVPGVGTIEFRITPR